MWQPWQTQSNTSPCIPQTKGGGPEINREGDRGGDRPRWNQFINSKNCSLIFPHLFWSLPLVPAALRWFMLHSHTDSRELFILSPLEFKSRPKLSYVRYNSPPQRPYVITSEDVHTELTYIGSIRIQRTELNWPYDTGGWDSWTETCLCPTGLGSCKTDICKNQRGRMIKG